MAQMILPDGTRYEVTTTVTSAPVIRGQKVLRGTIDGDTAVLDRAFRLNGVKLITDRGGEIEVIISPDGAGWSYEASGA